MRVAVIGVGRMGRRHIEVAKSLGLELAGICDMSPDALAAAGKDYGISTEGQFTDAQSMLKKVRPDCVIIATTSPTHCTYTCMAAEAGAKYILCEKPMATSLSDCDRMIDACKNSGSRLSINHQMRFMQQYTEPKRLMQSDAYGGLASVTVVGGNFGLAMNGTHYFEMFRYLTDEDPDIAQAWFSIQKVSNPRGPQFEDRAGSVLIQTASGKRFYLDVGANQGHGVKVIYTGKYGQVFVDELNGVLYEDVREEQHRNMPTTRYGMPNVTQMRRIEPADSTSPTKAVLKALLDGNDTPTGEQGRSAVAALVAAYRSDECGHIPVHIDDFNIPRDKVFPWA